MFRPDRTIRDDVEEAIENGLLDKDYMITAMLKYMSTDDVADMLRANDIDIEELV